MTWWTSLWSLFDLDGTASRTRAWMVFGVALVVIIAGQVVGVLAPDKIAAVLLPVVLASFALTVALVQRLHDTGRSGYWVILTLIPLAGLLVTIAILCLRPNQTAPAPHPIARRIGTGVMGVLLVVALMRVAGLWHPYFIPSESSKPTLLIGDFLIATATSAPRRGDVLVFRHPVNGTDYIKRLIGLPGDTIQMRDGLVWLNGSALPQRPNGTFDEVFEPQGPMGNLPRCQNAPVALGGTCIRARLTETLPDGRSYDVLNTEDGGFSDNTDVYTVPPAMLFFLGDNRDNSMDSRFAQTMGGLGFVPMENVKGRARTILFSSAAAALFDIASWRPGRYLQAVE